jgi:hypothetical protein
MPLASHYGALTGTKLCKEGSPVMNKCTANKQNIPHFVLISAKCIRFTESLLIK